MSNTGGHAPRRSRDGGRLFYISDDLRLCAVTVTPSGSSIDIAAPRSLFQTLLAGGSSSVSYEYDLNQDGRFLMAVTPQVATEPLTIVINWASTLKR